MLSLSRKFLSNKLIVIELFVFILLMRGGKKKKKGWVGSDCARQLFLLHVYTSEMHKRNKYCLVLRTIYEVYRHLAELGGAAQAVPPPYHYTPLTLILPEGGGGADFFFFIKFRQPITLEPF